MLLPPFSCVGLRAYGHDGNDVTDRLFLANDFMRVDADYGAKPPDQWAPGDWPRTYQSPAYPNIFAAGIAFAPPHAIPLPHTSPNGTLIAPAPPRTGMPSAEIGKAVAHSIVDMIRGAEAAGAAASSAAPAKDAAASNPAKVTAETALRHPAYPLDAFLRTFVAWQLWRFARINLKMIRIIRRSRT
jgi:sulfide:quinone oxidoreductase